MQLYPKNLYTQVTGFLFPCSQLHVFNIDFVMSPNQYLYVGFVFAAKAKQYAKQAESAY